MTKETSTLFSQTDGIVWDLDGVHYSYAPLPSLYDQCAQMAVDAARHFLPHIPLQDAFEKATRGFKIHGSSCMGFEDDAAAAGLDVVAFRQGVFERFQKNLFHYISTHHPQAWSANPAAVAAFDETAAHLRHGIATHSCGRNWARPLLDRLGLRPYFNDRAIIGMSDVDFESKARSARAIIMSLDALDLHPGRAVFVEDTMHHLQRARELHPDMRTVYIHHGKPLDTLPDYVDAQFYDNTSLVRAIHRQKTGAAPR